MRIYTKTGDQGKTSLLGGKCVLKSDLRICAIGEIDELNASLGVLISLECGPETKHLLKKIQSELFILGAELAGEDSKALKTRIEQKFLGELEREIDLREDKLPELRNFILPGGSHFSAHTHLARTACRRAERSVVALGPKNKAIIPYLNRLSDLLFILAREGNHDAKVKEIIWRLSTS